MVSRISARRLWGNTVGKSVFVHQPQGGMGLFERAHARVAYRLAYEGDGRSISRSQGGQWRQDDKAPGDQILVFERSGEPSSGGKLKDQILVPKTKFLVF